MVQFPALPDDETRVISTYTVTLTITAGTVHSFFIGPKPPNDEERQKVAALLRNGVDSWAGPEDLQPTPWPEDEDPGPGFAGASAGAAAPAPRPPPRPRRTRRKQPGLPLDPAPDPPTE